MDVTNTTAAPVALPTAETAAPPPGASPGNGSLEVSVEAVTAAPELSELERIREAAKGRVEEQRARERLRAEAIEEARKSLSGDYETRLAADRERIVAETRAEIQRKFRTKPVDAINELELDGAQFVGELAKRSGQTGPVYDELAEMRAAMADMKKSVAAEYETRIKAIEDKNKSYEEQIATAERRHEEKTLFDATSARNPSIPAYFGGPDKVAAAAREIANEYCEIEGKSHCPIDFIVSELALKAKRGVSDRLKAIDAEREALAKLLDQPRAATELPAESKGLQATRTLSTPSAGERRATPKPREQMTAQDLDEEMRAAARAAMGDKASKNAKRPRMA